MTRQGTERPAAERSRLQVSYVPHACAPHIDDAGLLALIRFTAEEPASAPQAGVIDVGVTPLAGDPVEVWRTEDPVLDRGVVDGIAFNRNQQVVMGQLRVAEPDYPDFAAATQAAYARLYRFIGTQGYPYPLRVWNFFPAITRAQGSLERYQAFCAGRQRALGPLVNTPAGLPAASAIGTRTPSGFLVYFLAAREPGAQVENPRQVSAFHYPARYSPKSPTFSRAIAKHWANGASDLYISGTASIVGHESRHPASTLAQLDETLENLQALIARADQAHALGIRQVRELTLLKVYVREAADREAVLERLHAALGTPPPMLILQGDICRQDLSVEIEALYTGSPTPRRGAQGDASGA